MRRIAGLLLLVVSVGSGCGYIPLYPLDPNAAFSQAVKDAENAEAWEIYRNLTPILASTEGLIWEGESGKSRVLMTAFTTYQGYKSQVGQTITLGKEVWLTAAPQVREFIADRRVWPDQLDLRLVELLGLPPDGKARYFVEMWVDPNNLFRPSPDPEITDYESELTFPGPNSVITLNPTFVGWYNNQVSISYGPGGYPWTRLGYTYDWGSPICPHVGLSEYIAPAGASVTIKQTAESVDYCRWW